MARPASEDRPPGDSVVLPTDLRDDLRQRIAAYLRAHHTMTLATLGPPPGATTPAEVAPPAEARPAATSEAGAETLVSFPHAASVFYAVDDSLRLYFLSQPSSLHGLHIGERAPVAVTVTEQYADWELIQGVQLWGEAVLLTGVARATGFAVYLSRFPFVSDLLKRPRLSSLRRTVGVYRVEPRRLAFTDNTTGVFGREVLEVE